MSDKKYDKFFEVVLDASMIIASLKLILSEKVMQKLISILEEKNIKLTKDNLDDIEQTTLLFISEIEPSFFNIPLGWEPKSEEDMRTKLETLDEKKVSKIVDDILNKFKSGQSSLSRYF